MDFYQILGTWSEGILNLIRYSAGLRTYVLELKSEGKLNNTSTCTQMLDNSSVTIKWVKIFKNGPSKLWGRQPLKNLKWYMVCSRPYYLKFFKGCLPQILFGPFFNTLTQIIVGHHFLRVFDVGWMRFIKSSINSSCFHLQKESLLSR